MNPRVTLALVLVCAAALGALLLAARSGDDQAAAGQGFQGATMPDGVRAPDFSLRDQDGG